MIAILDFGSQYTQLIARRVRELKVYCEIYPCTVSFDELQKQAPSGVILSGGPSSVNGHKSPACDNRIFSGKVPVLGICYGMQMLAHAFGGKVSRAKVREFGNAEISVEKSSPIFEGLPEKLTVWMSHGDEVGVLPKGFTAVAQSHNQSLAAMSHSSLPFYGVQFHPEVAHTPMGKEILSNFLFRVCREKPEWEISSFLKKEIEAVRAQAGKEKVICALSGGVDSSVAALLVHKAIGSQLQCVFVENGLLRWGEKDRVREIFGKQFGRQLRIVDARKRFLDKLKNVSDPERKRKIIGKEFIRVFESAAKRIGAVRFLVQGTLYPDVIESQSVRGPSAVIKTHHNVGGLPKKMNLKLIEPLKYLFKDEVRALGRELGLPDEILSRHPFPGPGLAVRVLGSLTEEKLEIVCKADRIVEEEVRAGGIYNKLWQAFAVLVPVKTVGVMGDARTYEKVIAVRAVNSLDAMTADWADIPKPVLAKISNRIINEVRGVNRVVYDISSKPPATIECE